MRRQTANYSPQVLFVTSLRSQQAKNKNRTVLNKKSVSKPSNHEPSLRSGRSLQEAPARHMRASGERAAISVPVRKDLLTSPPEAKSKDPFGSFYNNRLRRMPQVFCKTYKKSKPSSTEAIVLSSDDEGAEEMNDVSGSLQEQWISEGIRDAQSPNTNAGGERSKTKVEVPTIIELDFSRLHYDPVEAQANGTIVITDVGISIPLKGQACPFILLVLSGRLDDLQAALLTSLMDVIGLRYGQGDLSNSLSWPDGLNRLHCHPRGEHLLSLLGQNMKDTGQDTAKQENTSGTSSWLREPTVRRPLRSHSRQQSSPRRLIQYPPPPSKGGITVTTEDLECLKDGGFLNDVIIDFYVKYLLLERVVKDVAERSHIFRSFFYKQLTRKYTSCPEETSRIAPYRRHQRVRTWTRHVDIFSKDYLFIPVNQEAHWYLVVICFPSLERPECVPWRNKGLVSQDGSQTAKASSAGDCQRGNGLKPSEPRSHNPPDCTVHSCTRKTVVRRPCILVTDSLKLSYHQRIYTLLREYLQLEWEVRKGTAQAFTRDLIPGVEQLPAAGSSDLHTGALQWDFQFWDKYLRLEHVGFHGITVAQEEGGAPAGAGALAGSGTRDSIQELGEGGATGAGAAQSAE
ncbi:sentrin-specific protease 7-like [Cyprinus carpio]|uniref:Sentrin-specific protease 7-like n=1 Tax=Cyprinus carpio TaxID=7962 RepID=A0A9Q9ZNT8_CYPCA|nr:sentrin-specific protease 7-like [Cyprinus carpio]